MQQRVILLPVHPDITGSYVVKGTFYNDTGSGGGSFAFDTATGVVSDPPAPPAPPTPVIPASNPTQKLVESVAVGYVFNTYKMMSVQRGRIERQVPFKLGVKGEQSLRRRTNEEFTGSA